MFCTTGSVSRSCASSARLPLELCARRARSSHERPDTCLQPSDVTVLDQHLERDLRTYRHYAKTFERLERTGSEVPRGSAGLHTSTAKLVHDDSCGGEWWKATGGSRTMLGVARADGLEMPKAPGRHPGAS